MSWIENDDTMAASADVEDASEDGARHSGGRGKSSAAVTLIVFVGSLLLVRWLMPHLVEELHYAIERGKQRARHDLADEQLASNPLAGISSASKFVAQRIAPSVVHIDTARETAVPRTETDTDREIRGQGSGVVLTSDGQILTNHHVIRGAEAITVTLSDDRKLEATVIGVDDDSDLALLQLDGVDDLIPAVWGDSDEIENGSMVWAAGSPFGLSKSTTFGIVSAIDRRLDGRNSEPYFQTDVPVQAGNSGGPLVNAMGQVVGINTAILGPSFHGISFSIPAKSALESYQRMLDTPQAEVGWLGVRLFRPDIHIGAKIGLVLSGSPAEKAGITTGDIITHWGPDPVDSPASLSSMVRRTKVNEKVRVTLIRAASEAEEGVDVTVESKPLQF